MLFLKHNPSKWVIAVALVATAITTQAQPEDDEWFYGFKAGANYSLIQVYPDDDHSSGICRSDLQRHGGTTDWLQRRDLSLPSVQEFEIRGPAAGRL